MKKLVVIALALCLSACAGTLPSVVNPITADRLVTIKSGYGIALSAAVAYRSSCEQRIIPPSCRTVVPQIVNANRKVQIALVRLESLRKLGPTIDISEAVEQLSAAVNDLKLIVPGGM